MTNNTAVITVRGMMCAHCEAHVSKALSALDGVTQVTADHNADRVTIAFTEAPTEQAVKAAVEGAGYRFVSMEI